MEGVRREVKESPLFQGKDEAISYQLTTTPWGSSPTDPVVTIYDDTNHRYEELTKEEMDVVMPTNNPSVNGDIITISPITALTPKKHYRVEVQFTSGGNIFECWFIINAEN